MKLDAVFVESTENFKVELIEESGQFEAALGEIQIVTEYIGGELYGGEYTVIPKVESQTMPTKGKVMADDVTIREIPVFRVSNTSGGTTVYIAKEV